jgi:hypothetical protein
MTCQYQQASFVLLAGCHDVRLRLLLRVTGPNRQEIESFRYFFLSIDSLETLSLDKRAKMFHEDKAPVESGVIVPE